MDFGEVQDNEYDQNEENDACHQQESDSQELIGATEGVDLGEINVLFAIKLRDLELVADLDAVLGASLQGGPDVTPELDEGGEALHLIPDHDVLVGDV